MDNPIVLTQTEVSTRSFITKVYGWMSVGLALTGWIAAMIGTNESFLGFLLSNKILFYGLILGEFALVIGLSAGINKMTAGAATLAFGAYAAFNGVTLSVLFAAYTASSIASTFFITAGTFGAMSLYGYTTKTDLTTVGNICFMALIGLVLASLVNIFLHNPTIYWITGYLGILIFVGLTAYDTQKLKNFASAGTFEGDEGQKMAIMGALTLYLDFVNLFLSLLRVMGKKKIKQMKNGSLNLPRKTYRDLERFFSKRKEIKSVTLYGSRARGDAERTSDIDLSISAPTATKRQWLDICTYLSEQTNSLLPINVVRWDEISTPLKNNIRKEGQILYVHK